MRDHLHLSNLVVSKKKQDFVSKVSQIVADSVYYLARFSKDG